MDQKVNSYLENLISPRTDYVKEMQAYAKENRVPIMESVAIELMLNQMKISQPKKILEIGTAIGYSALRMLDASPDGTILTIEKDANRVQEAKEFIRAQQKSDQIQVVEGDALEVLGTLQEKEQTFDYVFIDAAKGKYREFFDGVDSLLQPGGWLVTDNVLFRGYVANPDDAPKRYKKMVKRIRDYNEFLSHHPDYITSIIPIGDGVMFSYKKV
jgi:predicted O-methyltransferase YrrM